MKKVSIFLAIAMLLGATNSFASEQIDPSNRPGEKIKLLSNEELFSKADYIIEVKSAGREFITHYDAGGNYNPDEIYTSIFIIVTHVYKNNETMRISPGDTLHYFRKGGWIFKEDPGWGIEQIWAPQPVDYDTGEIGGAGIGGSILFMKKSDLPENPDASKRSKHPKVSMLQDIKRATIKLDSEYGGGEIYGLNGLHFANRYELYKYMEQFEGVTVPLSDRQHMRWYLRGHDGLFDQYLKERNLKWPDTNDPRPATQPCIFFINSENKVTVKLYNMSGKEVFSQVANGQTEIDLSHCLPIGVYVAVVFSEDKKIEQCKVVIQ